MSVVGDILMVLRIRRRVLLLVDRGNRVRRRVRVRVLSLRRRSLAMVLLLLLLMLLMDNARRPRMLRWALRLVVGMVLHRIQSH